MRRRIVFLSIAILFLVSACSQAEPQKGDELVFVRGGTFKNTKSNYFEQNVNLSNFYIGKYEVTQKEWVNVMGSNPSQFVGDDLPVEMVSWYDVIEYCNLKSIIEGLEPFYNIDKSKKDPNNQSENDHLKWTVTMNEQANGYRLPTEAEWEYAASGGQLSKSYKYSGSNEGEDVAWYFRNAGDQYLSGDWNWPMIENNNNRTKPIGKKKPNELGLYDMSGNVREWCWSWYGEDEQDSDSGAFRVVRGGGWIGDVSSSEVSFRGKFEANGFGPDQGFRISRSE